MPLGLRLSRRGARVSLLWLIACGCGGGPALHIGPEGTPGRVPQLEAGLEPFQPAPFLPLLEPEAPAHPVVDARIDEVLSSPVLADRDFEEALSDWLEYWRGPAGPVVPAFLGRMASYGGMVDSALAVDGLPPSLRYLPFIESGYDPNASSPASAVGMWQFMEATARERGMVVSPLLDQRRDPVASTDAATSFLTELRDEFGSWFWALAAYNSGPNRVRRVLRAFGGHTPPSDSLFWALRWRFPRETRDFVPKLIAAALVASDPGVHGFEPAESEAFRFDEVTVPDATTLDVVARAAGVPQEEIERLNPQYLRGMTPPAQLSRLRVPEGRGAAFVAAYAAVPAEERVTFVLHRISQGETLSHIAVRYGVRVAEIEAANPGIRPRYLRVGRSLTVPVAASARQAVGSGG